MSLIDAREAGLPDSFDTDICIVGAGAAGITLAASLLPTGRDICLIESGGLAPDPAVQALYDLENTGYPQRPDYMSRVRAFGGSCNLWAGRSMPLNPSDFEPRDWVPHSGWPIPYDEVARYYPAAARVLGLPDLDEIAARRVPDGLSADERGLFGSGRLAPTVSAWAPGPMRFGRAFRSRLRAAGNVRAFLNLSATRLRSAPDGGSVEALEACTLEGRRHVVRARHFILACGGLENARLLLLSRDRQPAGLGNDSDCVGRYFMDHPRAVFGRITVPAGRSLPLLRGRLMRGGKYQLGIGLSADTQRRERMLNHYVTFEELTSGYTEAGYQRTVQLMKVALRRGHAGSRLDLAKARASELPEMIYLLSPKELMPHSAYRAYAALRDWLPRRPRPSTYVVVYFCEQPPLPESRVRLATDTDALGLPKLTLHWQLDREFVDSVLRMQELLRREIEQTGFGRLEAAADEPAFTDASHHIGTTRMSSDPGHGVVDTECRVHGMRNLYLAGSSVFPCAGHANPTLTIVALALRLADTIAGTRSRNAAMPLTIA